MNVKSGKGRPRNFHNWFPGFADLLYNIILSARMSTRLSELCSSAYVASSLIVLSYGIALLMIVSPS